MNLLELMLVGLLSSFIITGLMQLYLVTKHNFELQVALASIQERGRFVSYFLRKRIRQAGYSGCENSHFPVDEKNAIKGFSTVSGGSDQLQIKACVWYRQKYRYIKMLYYVLQKALYAKPLIGQRQEIVRGVVAMHVKFGVELASNTIQYRSLQKVRRWVNVVSVEVYLLLRSLHPILKEPLDYWYQERLITSKDKYLYQAWPVVINLRERQHVVS